LFFTKTSRGPDYAVAVIQQERSRVLVCMHDGKDSLLGAVGSREPFSDMSNDDYMSSNWRVCSKSDVVALRKYYPSVPEPANQAICFLWEDGEAIIYWDGSQIRWKSLEP